MACELVFAKKHQKWSFFRFADKKSLLASLEETRAEAEAAKSEADAERAAAERRVAAMQRECELAALTSRELQEKARKWAWGEDFRQFSFLHHPLKSSS